MRRPTPRPRRGCGRALVGLDPLPLAIHVGRGPRDRVAEDVRMAADDLRGDRRLDVGEVEDAGLGRQLGVEDDLEPQVAELAGQLGRGPGLERVVDLVRLLEEVLAERGVGLLAVPRAAVGLAEPGGDPGHRPRPGDRQFRCDRSEVDGALERRRVERPDGRAIGRPEPTDRVLARVEPSQEGQRIATGRAGATRQWCRRRVAALSPERRERDDQQRARRFDRRAHEGLAGEDLEPVAGIESPAEPRLRDERVEHRPLPPVGRAGRAGRDGWIAGDEGRRLLRVVPPREGGRGQLLELPALGRPGLLGDDLEQVRPVTGDRHDVRGLADRRREDGGGEPVVELALGDPAEVAAGPGRRGDRGVAGEDREVRALVGLVLEGLHVVGLGRVIHDLDDVPAEGRLDRRQDVAVLEAGGEDRGLERRIDRARAVEERQLAAGPGRALGLPFLALLAGDRVEQVGVGLEPRVGRRRERLGSRPGRIAGGTAEAVDGSPLGRTGCGGP